MPLKIVEGYTGALDFDLLAGGIYDTAASTADAVELILRTRDGIMVATSGNVTLQASTSSGGSVVFARYLPDVDDLQAKFSPYGARFRVTRAGRLLYYPSTPAPDRWDVGPL